jgi:O-antigen/teichoic acid export membrane protein
VFAVLFVTAALAAPQGALGNYLAAAERMWTRLGINVIWATILIAGAAALIEQGAFGVALAALMAYGARTVLTYLYLRRLTRRP